jgi:hypothetical protein
MKTYSNTLLFLFLISILFVGCIGNRKLINDEIVFNDGNSQTGTILQSDSSSIKVKKMDESVVSFPWSNIDTIQGKRLKTLWLGVNSGYYKAPYFSVFRNEKMVAENFGMQFKLGLALRGDKLFYFNLTTIPARPYAVTKIGLGFQRYIGKTTYIGKNSYFWGAELNLMNAKYNNSSQATLEPFTGYERKLQEHIRVHFKLGLQFNMANKNNQAGVNATIGFHFMRRNFKRYYQTLNKEHRLPRL